MGSSSPGPMPSSLSPRRALAGYQSVRGCQWRQRSRRSWRWSCRCSVARPLLSAEASAPPASAIPPCSEWKGMRVQYERTLDLRRFPATARARLLALEILEMLAPPPADPAPVRPLLRLQRLWWRLPCTTSPVARADRTVGSGGGGAARRPKQMGAGLLALTYVSVPGAMWPHQPSGKSVAALGHRPRAGRGSRRHRLDAQSWPRSSGGRLRRGLGARAGQVDLRGRPPLRLRAAKETGLAWCYRRGGRRLSNRRSGPGERTGGIWARGPSRCGHRPWRWRRSFARSLVLSGRGSRLAILTRV